MLIGPATVLDARAIAQVQVQSWQHAYQGILPREMLATMGIEQREARWRWAGRSSPWAPTGSRRPVRVA